MKSIRKLTQFFRPVTNEDVHQAAVAADASKLNLTLLQQMAESEAKYIPGGWFVCIDEDS